MTDWDYRPAVDRLIDGGSPPPESWGGPPRPLPPRPTPRHLQAPPRPTGRQHRADARAAVAKAWDRAVKVGCGT